jgi:hypothetical protein
MPSGGLGRYGGRRPRVRLPPVVGVSDPRLVDKEILVMADTESSSAGTASTEQRLEEVLEIGALHPFDALEVERWA